MPFNINPASQGVIGIPTPEMRKNSSTGNGDGVDFCLELIIYLPGCPAFAYVRHSQAERIIVFLREWVVGSSLRGISIAATPESGRQKQASYIRDTVRHLHKIRSSGVIERREVLLLTKTMLGRLILDAGIRTNEMTKELADLRIVNGQAVKEGMEFLSANEDNRERH
ncbi:hypothetical protein CHU98_g169 [Xylaria longipes]|nr:hypothetical protein CHU98_g169 [Xylaria longipes]